MVELKSVFSQPRSLRFHRVSGQEKIERKEFRCSCCSKSEMRTRKF